jgi:hypothetical protein
MAAVKALHPDDYMSALPAYRDEPPMDSWERGDSIAMDLRELHAALKDGA